MKKIILSIFLVLGMASQSFAAVNVDANGGNANATTGPSTSSVSDVSAISANQNQNNNTAVNINAGNGNSSTRVNTRSVSSARQANNQLIVQNYEASKIPPPLVGTVANTNNPELYDLKTGTTAQTANLSFLLWQSWSPDHRELVEGCSDRTKMIVVVDDKINQYKSENGKGENSFVLLNERTLEPEGLGSITIYPIIGKGADVDGSTIRADIKEYVNRHYNGLKVYFKKSWAASMYGINTKGRAGQIMPTGTIFGATDLIGGLAGAFGGNNGSSEPLPTISLTVILSDK